jgi:hypothetical protein
MTLNRTRRNLCVQSPLHFGQERACSRTPNPEVPLRVPALIREVRNLKPTSRNECYGGQARPTANGKSWRSRPEIPDDDKV